MSSQHDQKNEKPRQRFSINLSAQGAEMVNASLTGFRLVFANDTVTFGKKGTVAIALTIPNVGVVKVRARLVWVHFAMKSAGFEITENNTAYEAYIRSLESAA